MQIFPAIDLKDKQVVRLTQGDYGKVEVYGQDPAAAARGFAAQGAKYLHVVDLDGAKDGALSNFDAVSAISRPQACLWRWAAAFATRRGCARIWSRARDV